MAEKKKLSVLIGLEKVTIQAYSFFVGHVYMLHGGCGFRGSHSLRYLAYLLTLIYERHEAVLFPYDVSYAVKKKLQWIQQKRSRTGW